MSSSRPIASSAYSKPSAPKAWWKRPSPSPASTRRRRGRTVPAAPSRPRPGARKETASPAAPARSSRSARPNANALRPRRKNRPAGIRCDGRARGGQTSCVKTRPRAAPRRPTPGPRHETRRPAQVSRPDRGGRDAEEGVGQGQAEKEETPARETGRHQGPHSGKRRLQPAYAQEAEEENGPDYRTAENGRLK